MSLFFLYLSHTFYYDISNLDYVYYFRVAFFVFCLLFIQEDVEREVLLRFLCREKVNYWYFKDGKNGSKEKITVTIEIRWKCFVYFMCVCMCVCMYVYMYVCMS